MKQLTPEELAERHRQIREGRAITLEAIVL